MGFIDKVKIDKNLIGVYLNKIILLMKDEYPIYKNIESYGFNLSEDELDYVLSGIFGEPVTVRYKNYISIYDEYGNILYYENSNGLWIKYEYDNNGNQIYYEDSNGNWRKYEYDNNGNKVYYENSNGFWRKSEYDNNGNEIYYENSNGLWRKREYDEKEYIIYYEDSHGRIKNYR